MEFYLVEPGFFWENFYANKEISINFVNIIFLGESEIPDNPSFNINNNLIQI